MMGKSKEVKTFASLFQKMQMVTDKLLNFQVVDIEPIIWKENQQRLWNGQINPKLNYLDIIQTVRSMFGGGMAPCISLNTSYNQ